MAINFLQSLFNPQQSPSMPFNPAAAPPAMPEISGNLQRMTGGAPDASRVAELMQAIGGSPAKPAVEVPQQSTQRPRRSFLDTIGQLSDVVARVGGAEALYQPTLDAREDRVRQIDLEEMRKQQMQQQIEQGGQTLEAGEMQLADTLRSRAATALGALAQNPDAAAMWPQIAAQVGLDEQMTAQLGGLIDQGISPAVLAQSLGWSPPQSRQGSQAKELQVYGLLQKQDPALAQEYLRSIANPDSMTPKEVADLQLRMADLDLKRQNADFDRDMRVREFEADEAGDEGEGSDSNSVSNILSDFGVVLDGPEDPVADMISSSTNGWLQYGASMIPGALGISTEGQQQIAKLQTIDNALILALAGGKLGAGVSNADRAFFERMSGQISDPTIPADQRLAAWNQIKQRFRGILQREKKRPAASAPARRSSGQRIMPRTQRGQRPSASRNPAVEAELRRRGLID